MKATSQFRFDADKIIKDLGPKVFHRLLSDAQQKTRLMRCPEHGGSARITLDERGQHKAQLHITGCCDEFRKEVLEAIRRK